jgi:DNA mismatch repair protein MutS
MPDRVQSTAQPAAVLAVTIRVSPSVAEAVGLRARGPGGLRRTQGARDAEPTAGRRRAFEHGWAGHRRCSAPARTAASDASAPERFFASMTFHSVLFPTSEDGPQVETNEAPLFFSDLNLDQIVAAITAGREEYHLAPFFHTPLHDVDAIAFRHEVMQDLENAAVFAGIKAFALSMREVREHLAQTEKLHYEHQKERWFLDAVAVYAHGVSRLARDLSVAHLTSRGLLAFREYLARYASAEYFTSLVADAQRLDTALSAIRYNVFIHGPRVEVRHYAGEPDYSAEVEAAFERFQQGAVHAYTFRFSDSVEMNHIEAQILDGVAELHQDTFSALAHFCAAHKSFQDPTLLSFDREIQFYVAYLEYIARFRKAGLNFCYPRVSDSRKDFYDYQGFDLALAGKLGASNATPVVNDFYLEGPERIIVVSGPNQGGKTTTARTFGQLHYLGSLGCLVPGTKAQLYLPDRIFTHFDREEHMTTLRGKLEDDLIRIHEILETATPRSIIIINEIFASTALRDAISLSKRVAAALMRLDVLCVWVTFIDEVASLGPQTVSMVTTIVPDNPAQRTFKVVRRPADGLAYAMAIAEKYGLTYDVLTKRLAS